MTARLAVVGSVNLDIVASGAGLPRPGETVTGAALARHPGGKGANQALAARRLGADVRLVARVGPDAFADEALALLRSGGVDLEACAAHPDHATGVALICVDQGGENQIAVAPGANLSLEPDSLPDLGGWAVLMQLEIPLETVAAVAAKADGFLALNLAPAAALDRAVLERADLIIVNETEAAFYGEALEGLPGLVAVTLGARGARLTRGGAVLAEAAPPPVQAVDTTGAGDVFSAALTVALIEGKAPEQALRFACTAGALAATAAGAQPSAPTRAAVEAVLGETP